MNHFRKVCSCLICITTSLSGVLMLSGVAELQLRINFGKYKYGGCG